MKKTALLLVFVSLYSFYTNGMHNISKSQLVPSLAAVLEHDILTIPQICCAGDSVTDASRILQRLVVTSKYFNIRIDNPEIFKSYAIILAARFKLPTWNFMTPCIYTSLHTRIAREEVHCLAKHLREKVRKESLLNPSYAQGYNVYIHP